MRRTYGAIVVGLLAAAAVAACGEQSGNGGAGAPPAGSAPGGAAPAADPVALIGSWRVMAAAGEEKDAVLRVAPGEVSLWRECGSLFGSWRASVEGMFVADLSGGSNDCTVTAEDFAPAWLGQAAGFRVDGDARLLLDRRGAVLVRLLPGGRPEPGPDVAPELAEPPVVTEEIRAEFRPAAPLPAGLVAAEPGQLVGRWVPTGGRGANAPKPPFAELTADGRWQGSDGCNGQGGRWVAGSGGVVLVVAGPQTLIGCDSVNVGGWLSDTARAGFDGEELVLHDKSGKEIGRLIPAS